MWKLTLTKGYTDFEFEFDDYVLLCKFMQAAIEQATENVKATVEYVEEGEE